jgi:hypothetical protein
VDDEEMNTSKARERERGKRAYCLAVPDKGLGVVCEVLDCVHRVLACVCGLTEKERRAGTRVPFSTPSGVGPACREAGMADQHARDAVPTSLLSDLHVSYIQSLDKVGFSLLSLSWLGGG